MSLSDQEKVDIKDGVETVADSTNCSVDVKEINFDVVDARISSLSGPHQSRYVYQMNHQKRGDFVIINNMTFDTGMNERNGSEKDAQVLQDRFSQLGFHVETHHNLGRQDMIKIMREIGSRDHSSADCFGFAVLSHGDEDGVYATDSIKPIRLTLLTDPIKGNRCPSLSGKPKLVFIQACRGDDYDDGFESTDAALAEPDYKTKLPMEADFIYAYSTTPGYFSWRHCGDGSWFIQALAEVLDAYGDEKEIVWILTRVNNIVAYEFESSAGSSIVSRKKQIPSIVSMLTKELYFRPKP